MKIKTFEFLVSNWAYLEDINDRDYKESEYKLNRMLNYKKQIKSASDIETTINDYLENNSVELVDMKVNVVDIEYHNNGRSNTIKMVYTLIVKEID